MPDGFRHRYQPHSASAHLNELKEHCNHSTLENYSAVHEKEHVNGKHNKNGAYRIAHIPPNQQSAIQANSAGSTRASPLQSNQLQDIQQRCREEVSLPDFYRQLSEHGIQLTSSFRGSSASGGATEKPGQIRLSEALERDADVYQNSPDNPGCLLPSSNCNITKHVISE